MTKFKKLIFLLCLIFWNYEGFSFSGSPIKLIELSKTEGDEILADSLYTLAKQYIRINLDTSLLLAESSAQLSERIDYTDGIYSAYKGISAIGVRAGDLGKSLLYVDKGLKLIEEKNLPKIKKLDLLLNRGSAYIYANDLGKAIDANIEALSLAKENEMKDKIGLIYNNMGVLYRKLNKYNEAVKIYQDGILIRKELKDTVGLANTYYNMGAVFAKMDSSQMSFDMILQAKQLYKKLDMSQEVNECNLAMGSAAFDLGLFEESYKLLSTVKNKSGLDLEITDNYRIHILLSELALKKQNIKEANKLILNIEDIEESDFLEEKITYYRLKSTIEEIQGNYANALQFKKQHQELTNNFNNKETREFRQEMNAKYESLQKDFEIKSLAGEQEIISAKLKVAQQRNIAFAIGTALLIGFLWILYTFYKKIKDKNVIITQANKDKEILLKEIHHRVKNNLQVITSLLSMQERKVTDTETKDALKSSKTRVQSMSILHKILYQGNNLKNVKASQYMSNLVDNILDTYVVDTKINVSLDVDDLDLDVDSLIPVGLISNELICNSIKHAFTNRDHGNLFIGLKESGDNITLTVKDDGVGLKGEVLPYKPGSLGKRLINSFVDQLNGDLKIRVNEGTSTIISFSKTELFKLNK